MGIEAEIERMVIRLMGDAAHYKTTMLEADKATERLVRSTDGRLRDLKGRFVKTAREIATEWTTKIGQAIQRTGQHMQQFGRSMRRWITLPVITSMVGSVVAFSSFDKAMTNSLSIMQATAEQQQRMIDLAKDLPFSGKLIQSPRDLAESYFFLASANKSVEQSMKLMAPVAKFATAGAFDMARATDISTDAQSALGMSVKDVQEDYKNMLRLSDALVKANTLANASVEQFGIAMTRDAGAAFKAYNIQLEEGVALLAAYADQGLKAELGGSSAGRMLRLLTKAAQDNAKAFEKYKIDVFDDSGEFRRFTDIIGDMERAFKGMSTETRSATLAELGFAARVQQVILPLLGTSDALDRYSRELKTASGITEEVADKQMKSFANQVKILWNQLKVVSIEIGEMLVPYLTALITKLRGALEWWRGLNTNIKESTLVIAGLAAAIGPLLIVAGSFVAMVGGLVVSVVGLIALGPAIAAALPYVAAVAAGVAAVVEVMALGIGSIVAVAVLLRNEIQTAFAPAWTMVHQIWANDIVPLAKELGVLLWNVGGLLGELAKPAIIVGIKAMAYALLGVVYTLHLMAEGLTKIIRGANLAVASVRMLLGMGPGKVINLKPSSAINTTQTTFNNQNLYQAAPSVVTSTSQEDKAITGLKELASLLKDIRDNTAEANTGAAPASLRSK